MKIDKSFLISAKTCTLKYNSQEGNETILNGTKYIIPIYQRPYSWSEDQVKKMLSDIFLSYWGNDRKIIEEPMFIGTMQLSTENEIIDGQQRLTTFLLLLKVLQNKYLECEELVNMTFDWLSTRVNGKKQEEYLIETINCKDFSKVNNINPYIKNAFFIKSIIDEETKNEEGGLICFNIEEFVKYILSKIYFVVIETQAGLSKTLQIFNAINTTGLDLNGGDIFKIRMYEYLRDVEGNDEKVFNEISELYERVDKENSALPSKNVPNIQSILSTYQQILIAKYDLLKATYSYSSDTFFERLFDSIFKITNENHFGTNITKVKLSICELNTIIDVRYKWEKQPYQTFEDAAAMHLIWWSRYSRHWDLVFIFLYKFSNEENYYYKMLLFIKQLSKLYLIYSVKFFKSVNEIHTFTYSLIQSIIKEDKSITEIIEIINKKIIEVDKCEFKNILAGEIAFNPTHKNLICRLSAMLEENYVSRDERIINISTKKIFEKPLDIEHIQPFKDEREEERARIEKEWGPNINSIGNLMLLEQDKNRSIGNSNYFTKLNTYKSSDLEIVKKQVREFSNWSLENSLKRKKTEIEKITKYLFDGLS